MDKTIRKYTDFEEMKADEYRYWQSRAVHERVAAVSELTQEQYAMKGEAADVPDFKELLPILNEHRGKCLVVGAYAVAIHAQPRATKDLDILVKVDADNAKAVFAALAKFGAPLEDITAADFAEAGPFFRMGREPVGVDVLTKIPGIEFEAAWQRRVEDVIDMACTLLD